MGNGEFPMGIHPGNIPTVEEGKSETLFLISYALLPELNCHVRFLTVIFAAICINFTHWQKSGNMSYLFLRMLKIVHESSK
jgi:hypothetical protein